MQAATTMSFEGSIAGFCRDAVRISLRQPRNAVFFAKVALNQRAAAKRRAKEAAGGTPVPPLMILDPAGRRNRLSMGCFVGEQDLQLEAGAEMGQEELRSLLREAGDRGISIVALAGKEPLALMGMLDITKEFPRMLFPLVTDGSLVDEGLVEELQRQPHVLPVISLHGDESETDGHEDREVSEHALDGMNRLSAQGLFFGASITVTRRNFAFVTSRPFVRDLIRHGCRMFLYMDYAPDQPGTEDLVPSERQRANERLVMALLRREFGAVFAAATRENECSSCDAEVSRRAAVRHSSRAWPGRSHARVRQVWT